MTRKNQIIGKAYRSQTKKLSNKNHQSSKNYQLSPEHDLVYTK
jgi:hypothetical protein